MKNNIKKIFNFVMVTLFLQLNVFAITIKENAPINNPNTTNSITNIVSGSIIMGVGVGIVVGIIIFIIYYIVNKVKEAKRKHKDLLYGKFCIEIDKCHQNRDNNFKSRNWKTLFFTFKRSDIYLQTKEQGLKLFGKYDGELVEKDNFYLISVYRVTGIFSREKDIIIVPYELRNLIHKEKHSKNYEMIIHAESIDEALNTDYYAQLVIKDNKDNNKLINFNEYIQTNFMEKYVLRQVIRDNLLDYKQSMDRVVELNPNIQVSRKDPKQ